MQNKVVIITGAGRGIGRALALNAAAHGAKVVVNDLGVSVDGKGVSERPATEVANEIKLAGGTAIADVNDVSSENSANSIIENTLKNFDKVDAVINNAGFTRDCIFHKMTPNDWQAVIDVHLNGSFYVSRAVAPLFKEQGHGNFIHITSTSGLIGNFGQANYAAAKLGVVGLSRSIALDMQKYNVRSNCISPFAWSRIVASIPATNEVEKQRIERAKLMSPEQIAPLSTFLLSEHSKHITGQIFGVRRNEIFLFSQPRPVQKIHCAEGWNPETVGASINEVMKPFLTPLERSSDVFNWDPI